MLLLLLMLWVWYGDSWEDYFLISLYQSTPEDTASSPGFWAL